MSTHSIEHFANAPHTIAGRNAARELLANLTENFEAAHGPVAEADSSEYVPHPARREPIGRPVRRRHRSRLRLAADELFAVVPEHELARILGYKNGACAWVNWVPEPQEDFCRELMKHWRLLRDAREHLRRGKTAEQAAAEMQVETDLLGALISTYKMGA
jgi:hypothetical protein